MGWRIEVGFVGWELTGTKVLDPKLNNSFKRFELRNTYWGMGGHSPSQGVCEGVRATCVCRI